MLARTVLGLLGATLNHVVGAYDLKVASSGGNQSSPFQYGLIFEDISHSGDGGLYAELVQNRAFQAVNFSSATVQPWATINGASIAVQQTNPLSSAIPFSLNVTFPSSASGPNASVGISNPGWWGINVQPEQYDGSFYISGDFDGNITASLQSDLDGTVFGSADVPVSSSASGWTQFNYTLNSSTAAPTTNNSLVLTFDPQDAKDGSLAFTLVSLFPPTFRGRANGNRVDLSSIVMDMQPSFLRMPGGNNLEGIGPAQDSPRWIWNNTIGPLPNRPGRLGAWGYYNTDGFGLNEYLRWCNDINVEPVLAVFDGHYLDGSSIGPTDIEPYVQSVMDELEYLMGPNSSSLGAQRAADGFPAPWNISFIEIGNEDNLSNGLSSYNDYRFSAYYDAIHEAFPNITIFASTQEVNIPPGAGSDFHLYTRPDDFVLNYFHYFDNATADNPVMIGEFAAYQPNIAGSSVAGNTSEPGMPYPWWVGTVSEAVFLIGTERNSHGVFGAAYAPLLANANSHEWGPNQFEFNASYTESFISTSAQMFCLFSTHRMTETLPVQSQQQGFGPLYYVAGKNAKTGSQLFKAAVYNATSPVPITLSFEGVKQGTKANLTVLTADDPYASVNAPGVNPVIANVSQITSGGSGFVFSLPNYSVALLETVPS